MNETQTNPTPQQKIVVQKPVSIWRLKMTIGFLTFLLIVLMAGASIAGIRGYMYYRDKNSEVSQLKNELDQLKTAQNLNIIDLQKQLNEIQNELKSTQDINKNLNDDLNAANKKITELTPKDIRDVKYDSLITINKANGDAWQTPVYTDLNGDGKADAVFAYKVGGVGAYLNVYAYSYIDNNLVQILKAEQYPRGEVRIQPEQIVEIKYQTGAPDAPEQASTQFKWDSNAKKLIKI